MGVTISANGSNRSFNCGYGGFFNLRKNIALAYDGELGEHYAKMLNYSHAGEKEYNKKRIKFLLTGVSRKKIMTFLISCTLPIAKEKQGTELVRKFTI